MTRQALVIGGNTEGVQAALDIANSGIEVSLVEQCASLQVEDEDEILQRQPMLLAAATHPNINILNDADVLQIEGEKGLFKVKVLQKAKYVNTEICVSCGRCEAACPVNLLSQFSDTGPRAIHRPRFGLKSVPSAYVIDKDGTPPCTATCPAGINVQGYVALISKGLFKEAADLIREAVPFPRILGRVCTHPCEDACNRGKIDQPIAIASLKRFAADTEPVQYALTPPEIAALSGKPRVAIIGSGPAGLTCARDLVRYGHRPTVFEALSVAGGMLAFGMPRFRLPREIREDEINTLINSGIEIRHSTRIGEDITIDDLKKQGYEAIFIGIGCHKGLKLGIPGEELEGVTDGVTFLRALRFKEPIKLGYEVVVIGGGYTGIDVARAAIRMHCNSVHIFEKYTSKEVSATKAEILETVEEGVEIEFMTSPIRIVEKDGKVAGVECQRLQIEGVDDRGRPNMVPVKDSKFFIKADTVILAIGQAPDSSFLDGLVATERGTVKVDPLTLSTNAPGIFAGGDAVTGPRSVVEAVAAGRRAAVSIDRYLHNEDMAAGRSLEKPAPVEVDFEKVRVHPGERRRIPCLPISERIGNFEEVETGYTNWMALREAKRCLNCGGCSGCMECVRACELGAINHNIEPREIELEAEAIVFAMNPREIANPLFSEEAKQHGVYTIYPTSKDAYKSQELTYASAVAGRVITDLAEYPSAGDVRRLKLAPVKSQQIETPIIISKPKIGVFVCRCGGGISDIINMSRLVGYFRKHSDVAYAQAVNYACSDEGANEIRQTARQYGLTLTHAVVAACSCCALDQICFSCSDRRVECKAKLLGQSLADGICYEFVNIREHCAWVHKKEPNKAMDKAKSLIRAGIARAKESQLQSTKSLAVQRAALVIGDGLGGLQAAADLARQGFPVTLVVDHEHAVGGEEAKIRQQLMEILNQYGAMVLGRAQLRDIEGSIGEYRVTIEQNKKSSVFSVGAVVLDLSAISDSPNSNADSPGIQESAGPMDPQSFIEKARGDDQGIAIADQIGLDKTVSRIPGVFLCGIGPAGTDIDLACIQGSAAAAKVSALLNRGEVHISQTIATVDPHVCRGCGTCATICGFGASSLVEKSSGVFIARIDESLCRGCGTCVAHCPSGALTQNGLSDRKITAALEAMLTTP